jgi:hypothetical protein
MLANDAVVPSSHHSLAVDEPFLQKVPHCIQSICGSLDIPHFILIQQELGKTVIVRRTLPNLVKKNEVFKFFSISGLPHFIHLVNHAPRGLPIRIGLPHNTRTSPHQWHVF